MRTVQIIGTVVILAAYVAALLWVGLRARMSRGFADFSVARRRLALAFVFASLSAAYVGPGFSVGFVGEGLRAVCSFWGSVWPMLCRTSWSGCGSHLG